MCLTLLVRGEVGRALQACGPGAELWLGAAELWSGVGRVHAKADGIPKAWSSLLGADPNRYRHSPERLKKGSQDDVSTHVHQGRRQSGKAGTLWAQRLLFRTFNQVGNQPSTAAFGAGSHLSGNPRKG